MKSRKNALNSVFLLNLLFCTLIIVCVLVTMFVEERTGTLVTCTVLGASVIAMIAVYCFFGVTDAHPVRMKLGKKNRFVK